MPEVEPGQTLDGFAIEDVLARSGMATIFRARDVATGEPVALKVPYLQYESDIVFHERFRREEEIGLKLHHPSIVRLKRPEHKSRMYLAMEFVEGELLRDRMKREKRLPIEAAVALAIQLCDVLTYVHDQGIVHRDLKPENVMLTPGGGLKIMDFGIAFDTTQRKMTWGRFSQSVGTPDYMAPEQIHGQRGDLRCDLYSVGAILYEMLTGQPPYTGDNVYAVLREKVERDPLPPRALRPEIPEPLEETILWALERSPGARPETAFELRESLAHPQSVVSEHRADRQRPALDGQRARRAKQVLKALAAYVLLWGIIYLLFVRH